MIRILSFESQGKALLYAGYLKDKFNNWDLADKFARANNMVPVQFTEGGQYLSVPDRKIDLNYSDDEFTKVWDTASITYCISIKGSVRTFVCGSNKRSTFRRKEIHAMLKSHTIENINDRPFEDFVRLRRAVTLRLNKEATLTRPERHKRMINHVFRAVAFQEIRQDLAVAREQNNEQDIQNVLARVGHLRAQQREDLQLGQRPPEMQKLSEQLAAMEEMTAANPDLHLKLAHG